MNLYEGLNLPQLLDLLRPVVEPEPVSWWPATDGWLVLGFWAFSVVLLITWQAISKHRRNRYRREALNLLDNIPALDLEAQAAEIATVLKRTALAAYPREQVASLFGTAWAEFLCHSSGNDAVVSTAAGDLAGAACRPHNDPSKLLGPARRWVEVHRA